MNKLINNTVDTRMIKKAIGYIRISTEEQSQYSLLNQQEFIEREVKRQDYELLKIFKDEGFSAKTTNRPGLIELLEYCRKNKEKISALFIYKYDRLSRDTYDFLGIKKKLSECGIRVMSVTEPAEDNYSGEFLQTILSAVAKLDNQMRAQRALEGMKKRFEAGWIPAKPPVGYLNTIDEYGRKIVVKDSKTFEIIKRAWEAMGTGAYNQLSIIRYLKEKYAYNMASQTSARLFRNPFYYGLLKSDRWGMERQGLHDPMITVDLFYKVQGILDGRSNTAKPRMRSNPLFPLRHIVKCGECGAPLTGSLVQGKTKRIPYYYCSKRTHKFKSIPKDKIEKTFIELLKAITPVPQVVKLFVENVKDKWHAKYDEFQKQQARIKSELEELEKMKDTLVEKNLAGLYDDSTYLEQMAKLKDKILAKKTIISESKLTQIDIEILTNFMYEFLSDLSKAWVLGTLVQKQIMVSSIFPQGLTWRDGAYRTLKIDRNYLPIQSNQDDSIKHSPLGEPDDYDFELLIRNYNRLMGVFHPQVVHAFS